MGAVMRAIMSSTGQTDAFAKTSAMAEAFGLHDTTTYDMQQAIRTWFALYFQQDGEKEEDPCQRLPYTIVHKLQKTVFAEYASAIVTDTGSKNEWIDNCRGALDSTKKPALQWALVGGAALLKPIPHQDHFRFTVLRRDSYAVFGRDDAGAITDIGTCAYTAQGRYFYTLAERRTATPQGVHIAYRLYRSDARSALGQRVPLTALPQYAELPEELLLPNVPGVGLVEMRLPMANCIDGSEDGVSVYAPAVGLIRNINHNEYLLNTEFDHGRSRVFASEDLLATDKQGRRSLTDDVFVAMDASPTQMGGVTIYSPALRDEAFARRRQGYLKAAENIIGLKRGILSDVEAAERTATEVTSSAGDYNLTIVDLQNMWYDAMRDALLLCDALGRAYRLHNNAPWDAEQLSMSWGNGVLYDARQEWQDDLQAVQAKLLRPEIALAHRYDLPCDTPEELAAIREKYMPEISSLLE